MCARLLAIPQMELVVECRIGEDRYLPNLFLFRPCLPEYAEHQLLWRLKMLLASMNDPLFRATFVSPETDARVAQARRESSESTSTMKCLLMKDNALPRFLSIDAD